MSGAIRNFIVVFLLALLGFGVLGHFIVNSIVPSFIDSGFYAADESSAEISDDSSEDVSTDESSEDEITVTEGNTFNFAFFCTDINEVLAGIFLVHTHDGYETCVTVPIPANASVENNGAYTTIGKLYADNGKDYVVTKLYYLTGCKIDEYATLSAVDRDGKGRNITELSTYLKYTYRVTEGFEYPNPDYIPGGYGDDYSSDVSIDNSEFISVEAGSYALNGKTGGILNEKLLLDTEWNAKAFDIYCELLTKMTGDLSLAESVGRQTNIFNYITDKSFRDYKGSGASAYLFNDFRKASFSYNGTGGAWDEMREAIKTLERKVQ